jgi:DNA-binding ferritin-like protein (Dps family)
MEDKKQEIMDMLEKIAILGAEINDPVGNIVSASCLILLEAVQDKQVLQIFSSTMYDLCDKISAENNNNTLH